MSDDLRKLLAGAAPAAAPAQRSASRRLLEQCCEPILSAIRPAVPGLLLEALGPLAKSDDADEAKPAKQVLLRDRAFAQGLERALRAEIDAAVDDFVAHRTSDQVSAGGKLSLIDYGSMEFATVVESAGNRIRNSIDDIYVNVKLRVANLVGERELRDNEVPFRPALFNRAVYRALEGEDAPAADRLKLLKCFDAPLIEPVRQAFQALDRHLDALGAKAEYGRPAVHRSAPAGETKPAGAATIIGGGPGGNTHADQVLGALFQRLRFAPATYAPAAPVAQPGFAVPPDRSLGAATAAQFASLQETVPRIHAPAGGALIGTVDPQLIAAINDIQRLGAAAWSAPVSASTSGQPGPVQIMDAAQLRGALAEKAIRQVDKLTIEIVGLLFDRIQRDPHVPAPIKELLQRLQFPLIKVALTDPELFVAPAQPARRLMDRIASTSLGWTQEGEENERYLTEVQTAVQAVLDAPEGGLEVFQQALARLDAYLDEERTRDDDPIVRAKRALAEAEEREVMAINATIKIRSAFDGVLIESYLRDFLLTNWVRVLVAATLRDKEAPGQARRFVAIVPDLIWSVQPKINPDDRKRLVSTIPPVLTALREGLMMIDWPKPKMREFFGKLMNSHAQAVKALELAHRPPGTTVAAFEPSTMRIKLDGMQFAAADAPDSVLQDMRVSDDIVRHVLAANHVEVEHLTAENEPATATGGTVIALERKIAEFKRGDWFDLATGDVPQRVKLAWISPRRTLYLFTPARGFKPHSLTPATLRTLLRNGRLNKVESAPLFDRAVQDVVRDLQHAGESDIGGATA